MFPKTNANWKKHFNNLLMYKKKHGDLFLGPKTEGWPGLYDWIHAQRKEYKRKIQGDDRALMYDVWIAKMNEVRFKCSSWRYELSHLYLYLYHHLCLTLQHSKTLSSNHSHLYHAQVGFDWAPMQGAGFAKMLLARQNEKFTELWQTHYE